MFLHILRRQDDKLHFIVNNHSKAQQKMENIINLRNTTYIYIYIYMSTLYRIGGIMVSVFT
jgi:hypothetical protein